MTSYYLVPKNIDSEDGDSKGEQSRSIKAMYKLAN